MSKYLLLVPPLSVVFLPIYLLYLKPAPPLPEVDLNKWWGSGAPKQTPSTIKPFTVKFGETGIKDLKDRLKNHRPFTPPLEDVGFQYGFNSKALDTWVKYWTEKYDFAEREKFLNQYPQYKTQIQGLDIHFIRITPPAPPGKEVVPMLLLHGWPGSVREFYEAIPHLTAVSEDRDFVLELIIPSLPGYGFSEAAAKQGLNPLQIAVIMRNLMHRLGFEKYYIQGGDWGASITSNMATVFPEEILGYHTNMPFTMSPTFSFFQVLGSIYPRMIVEDHLASRMYPMSAHFSHLLEETGYMHIQATKPDTVGVSLQDSPTGLLAYIVEKFSTWTRKEHKALTDGGLEFRFTKEQLLDNVMMYWNSGSIVTSMRLYSEGFNKNYLSLKLDEIPTPVPTWTIQAKHELAFVPTMFQKQKYPNLVNSTTIEDGGHFLALELPKQFAESVLEAVKSFRQLQKQNAKSEL